MNASMSAERALQLAEARGQELDSLSAVLASCPWWRWRSRRNSRRMIAGVKADIRRLVALSARLDGEA